DAGPVEKPTDELNARSLVARGIRGIEPDQGLKQLHLTHRDMHFSDDTALHHLPVDSREQRIGDASTRGVWMSVYESEWLRPASRSAGERRFRLLSVVAVALFLAYLGATLAGAPRQTSSLVFNIAVLPVPF